MGNNIIEVKNLKKYFGEIKAVDDITFHVKKGELFAFLGLNGAGKSTTISILCGQLQKDEGSVIIDGSDIEHDTNRIKSGIGIVFQNSFLDKLLTVRDNLELRAALYGITDKAFRQRLESLTDLLDLKTLLRRPVGKLSGGQRRRIDVARALLHDPKILILDEPTTGLDPQSRKMVWNVIEHLRKKEGLTVFLTTHYMEEASEADFVVILDNGKISAEGTPHDLKNTYAKDSIKLYGAEQSQLALLEIPYTEENGYIKIEAPDTAYAKDLILQHPDLFNDFEIIKGKMDDVFLAVTGKVFQEV